MAAGIENRMGIGATELGGSVSGWCQWVVPVVDIAVANWCAWPPNRSNKAVHATINSRKKLGEGYDGIIMGWVAAKKKNIRPISNWGA